MAPVPPLVLHCKVGIYEAAPEVELLSEYS